MNSHSVICAPSPLRLWRTCAAKEGTAVLLNKRQQRLDDLVANTIVVEQRRLALPDLLRLNLDEKLNSLLSAPHFGARLRQRITPDLVELAYRALLRREELTPDVKLEVFRWLADRFREVVRFPDEITAPLTDERCVRNALQVAQTTVDRVPIRLSHRLVRLRSGRSFKIRYYGRQ